jgi:hypothetical protein
VAAPFLPVIHEGSDFSASFPILAIIYLWTIAFLVGFMWYSVPFDFDLCFLNN